MRQLAGSDATFLSLETPTTHAHIGGVFVLEPVSPDFGFERFARQCAERLALAPAVLNLAYRMISATAASMPLPANTVVSNVPGAPIPLYLAGGRLVAAYPISIIMPGMGLNITVLSYVDRIDFGFTVDPDLVPDPWYLSDGIAIALDELKDAIGIDRATPLRPTRTKEKSA